MIEEGFVDYGHGIRTPPKKLTKNQKRWWKVGQTEARLNMDLIQKEDR
jgi:hypothetical protein